MKTSSSFNPSWNKTNNFDYVAKLELALAERNLPTRNIQPLKFLIRFSVVRYLPTYVLYNLINDEDNLSSDIFSRIFSVFTFSNYKYL